ncbi:tyrosine-type recombinase/integrase [Cytobacillus oceanisediminis]|uniref:tyrosine-type recombinase/integrase n=1 Tax=Cytobacillus oceanisediminis TaxID=665099 RepID=UPI00254E310E|nr:site-specific integrase [Cytobacillus oceanisediminis]MDK7665880.1 site-specific integrase [Cytobacillus oceanisediminis]
MGNKHLFTVVNNKQEMSLSTYEDSREFQAKLMGLWEQQQRVLGYTEETIALGTKCLNEFLDISNKFIWEVTMEDADSFYLGLVGRGLAYSTRRKYQSTISTFLDYLKTRHAHEIWERYKIQVPNLLDKFNRYYHRKDDYDGQVIPPRPEILERFWHGMKEEMKRARKYNTVARDYALFRMMELTGLRTHEIIMMDVKDCRFDLGEKGKVHVRFGKGSKGSGFKRRWVPMLDDVDLLLKWYLKTVRPLFTSDDEGPLFLSENRERLNKHTARKSLGRRQKKLGFTDAEVFSPHQLRHSFATRQTELGVDLLTLKELLGHADVATTFNYSNPGSDHVEKRVRMAQEKWRKHLLNFDKEGE